jgi:glutamine synthetase
MHLHQSVVNSTTGQNIFSGDNGEPSAEFYHFIGGSQQHLTEAMPLIAPYVNSYRRLSGGEAAPNNLEWSWDNRTTGLRIPISGPNDRRVENRVIGIDANPYLAIAASLAAGYLGLKNRIEPKPEATGEAFDLDSVLPEGPAEALTGFTTANELSELLGRDFCALFAAIKNAELDEFRREISTWEREHLLLNV